MDQLITIQVILQGDLFLGDVLDELQKSYFLKIATKNVGKEYAIIIKDKVQ
jgi:hypothetical protein